MIEYIPYGSIKTPVSSDARVIVPTASYAEKVVDELETDILLFGRTSVYRFKLFCDIPSALAFICETDMSMDKRLGWDEKMIKDVRITKMRNGGFEIALPKPVLITPIDIMDY